MSRNLAAALHEARAWYERGELALAEARCREVLSKAPRNAEALHLLGVLRMHLGDSAEAAALFAKAMRLRPADARLAEDLARAQLAAGRAEDALQSSRRAAALDPGRADAHYNVAVLLQRMGRLEEALAHYGKLLERCADHHDAWVNLGVVHERLGHDEEALGCYRKAVALEPRSARALTNMAKVLRSMRRLGEAKTACRRALEIESDFTDAIVNLAGVLAEEGESDEALREYERALAIDPDDAHAHLSHAMLKLALGDFDTAWRGYAWRPTRRRALVSGLALSTELPEPLAGARILVLGEQGLGDELFFLRFAPLLKALGAEVSVQCDAKLRTLLARTAFFAEVVVPTDPLPVADATIIAGDLPLLLRDRQRAGLVLPSTPPPLPLTPHAAAVERMRSRLARLGPPPYIGVTWRAGTPRADQLGRADPALCKELPFEAIVAALHHAPGTLVALQRNVRAGEIDALSVRLERAVHDFSEANDDLEEMLALLGAIEEYVGVSNTNMHLAAGLARAARVLVPNPPEWRWMWRGENSPWFPGFTLYRQRPDGDWSAAAQALARDLARSA